MPELPEVQTTVNGLRRTIIGLRIVDVWSSYNSPYFKGSETIKDLAYFKKFRKEVTGKTVLSIERRAKNILINLSGGLTILVHLKMTGHLLFGKYEFDTKNKKDPWKPISPPGLKDPFNRHVRFALSFSGEKYLALSDMRKFAKVTKIKTASLHESAHLQDIGPEPLEESFNLAAFQARLTTRPHGKIKLVLMDQSILAGVGNIYADESLWLSGIHPLSLVENIPPVKIAELFKAIKKVLTSGVDLGGASTSDFRNIDGEKGSSQESHHAYRRTDEACDRRGCSGTIRRMVVGARGTHFCDKHQTLFTSPKA